MCGWLRFLVPIIVAVIGVVRAVVPAVYVNSLQSRPDSDVTISASTNNHFPGRDFGISYFTIGIGNEAGNALATKLSIILESYSYDEGSSVIYSITNTFNTTNVVLHQYNDTILEPGSLMIVNRSPLEIIIPNLFMMMAGRHISHMWIM